MTPECEHAWMALGKDQPRVFRVCRTCCRAEELVENAWVFGENVRPEVVALVASVAALRGAGTADSEGEEILRLVEKARSAADRLR